MIKEALQYMNNIKEYLKEELKDYTDTKITVIS